MSTDQPEPIEQTVEVDGRGFLVVTYIQPRCPQCGSVDLKTQRSVDQGDGTRIRNTVCRTCGKKFFVMAE